MERQEIFSRLNNIFRELFDDETICLTEKTTADDIEGWDSLEHVNLVMMIESEFHMRFKLEEMSLTKDVGEMVNLIQKNTKEGVVQ